MSTQLFKDSKGKAAHAWTRTFLVFICIKMTWKQIALHLTCPCSGFSQSSEENITELLLLWRRACLTSLKVDLALPHQMVLEDNIIAKLSRLSLLHLELFPLEACRWNEIFRNHFYKMFANKCKLSLCFIRRTGGLLLRLPTCWSTATLTRKYLPLRGNNLSPCTCVWSPSRFAGCVVSQDMLDAFEAIQGKFRQIQSLTRRQKDQLKRFRGGNETSNGNFKVYHNQLFS